MQNVKKASLSCFIFLFVFLVAAPSFSKVEWRSSESEHFIVIYLEVHAGLVPHVLQSAEDALAQLSRLFKYTPTERIVINLYDYSDHGSAGANTLPRNFIRLEVEPLELGYENIPFNERLSWMLAHELVHVVVNDMSGGVESLARSLFSKVLPEKEQPLTIPYSLLTNFGRYTTQWHQEGMAVFMETWLNGGYGRILGNFDEMYFRAMVLEKRRFPSPLDLAATASHESFLLGTLSYLYGGRFDGFLAAAFGTQKLIAWYTPQPGEFYKGFEKKFNSIYGRDLATMWAYFIEAERRFQRRNLAILKSAPLTKTKNVLKKPLGWVTTPHIDAAGQRIIFGHHQPHYLTSVKVFDLRRRSVTEIGTLPAPSLIQVASTAYDSRLQNFFYTSNNNSLYRDVWVLNLKSGKRKILFEDARIGSLTISPQTNELWGVRHSAGKASLVNSKNPYRRFETLIWFGTGDDLAHLALSPSGNYLAATLHQANGSQSIIVADLVSLERTGKFTYRTISQDGSPEFPSWSPDEKYLYWNAYTNGVSNIYRHHAETEKPEAMSHTLRGLFRPAYLSEKYIFAFEFTSEGFIPVIFPNRPASELPAIRYIGQRIVQRAPEVTEWALDKRTNGNSNHNGVYGKTSKRYSGLTHLEFISFVPVLSGFQNRKVLGVYSHFADPLFVHDITLEIGLSPFKENASDVEFHFRGSYNYDSKYKLMFEYNAPSFYDLFNGRKSGADGARIGVQHTRYWKYDVPHKIKQTSELSFYTGIEAINDNLITVSNPDFLVFETSLNSSNVRRAIGSVDKEFGNDWTLTLSALALSPQDDAQAAGGLHAEWSHFHSWVWPHNILHLKLGAGYLRTDPQLTMGNFYFGGFGNQELEKKPVKQYRNIFRFPGLPIYSIVAESFFKIMLENSLPPLRVGKVRIGRHFLSHIDASWFSQALIVDSGQENKWVNLGGQINFTFTHWYNLDTTLSAGFARAWSDLGSSDEWFVSFKLLKD
ncbi:MAG: hypothetical protein O7G31_17070 [Calditrichaeota bacterium]|nr:hypothetical protein [Calditrichota bacterium]